jgi:hypothetical protein
MKFQFNLKMDNYSLGLCLLSVLTKYHTSHRDVALEMVALGADLSLVDATTGMTAFERAVWKGDRVLQAKMLEMCPWQLMVSQRCANLVNKAVQKNRLDVIRRLIVLGYDVDTLDEQGMTLLHRASRLGRVRVMRLVMAKGANIHAQTQSRESVVQVAIYNGQWTAAKMLIEWGASVNRPSQSEDMDPMFIACACH